MNKDEVIEKHFKLLTKHFSENEYHIAVPWIEHLEVSFGYDRFMVSPSESRIMSVEITREDFINHKWNSKLWKTMYGER